MGRPEKIENTLFRFLRTEPQGFTNIAAGLTEGVSQIKKYRGAGRRVGIIATDGRPTEGRDPLSVARQFDGLHVLHLHGAGSDLSFSQELAAAGRGVCLEVKEAKELPRRLYDAIRLISRR
jgi:Mg-chelatase subunit ChlD